MWLPKGQLTSFMVEICTWASQILVQHSNCYTTLAVYGISKDAEQGGNLTIQKDPCCYDPKDTRDLLKNRSCSFVAMRNNATRICSGCCFNWAHNGGKEWWIPQQWCGFPCASKNIVTNPWWQHTYGFPLPSSIASWTTMNTAMVSRIDNSS